MSEFDTASEELRNDLLIAIGALSVVPNERLNAVAIGLHSALPLLAALVSLGYLHREELAPLYALELSRRAPEKEIT
jgi:hypothetical protein